MKFTLAIALIFSSGIIYSQTTKLNLASDVWPPFTDATPKHAFAIDLVHEALGRTRVQEETSILDFKEVMNGINNKKFDGSAALWHSAEREKTLLFSDPYLENRLILVGKKGTNVSADTLSELSGKKIAIVESYAYGSLLDQAGNIVIVKGSGDQQNLDRLLKGEVDYMLCDALLIEYLFKYQRKEAEQFLEIGKNALIKLPLYFAIRRDIPGAETIMGNFNKEIRKMIADGSYNRILQLNWVSSDLDGDGLPELVLSGNQAGTEAPGNGYTVMSQPGVAPVKASHYVIEGKTYPSWDTVPEKYKVPRNITPVADKAGFGLVFNL